VFKAIARHRANRAGRSLGCLIVLYLFVFLFFKRAAPVAGKTGCRSGVVKMPVKPQRHSHYCPEKVDYCP
ncbi:MAG: hypothetical protein KDD28_28845, partial [Phaeodactylibacter sp.]|nr:hypothetical protein [Phaeodactylibacter sp.]